MADQKQRILMIAPLPPPVHGSAMMTQYLKESGMINDQFRLDWVNLSTSRSMDEIGKRSLKKIFRFGYSYFKAIIKLLSYRYDLCYLAITCHGKGFLKDAPFVLLCKLFGRKVIIHQHNKGMSRDVNKSFYRWLFKQVYSKSKVILLSWRLYPDIEQIVGKDQVYICPNGIPKTTVFPKSKKVQMPQILFLSNLIESKGVIVLLDACRILYEQGYKFMCRFIGGETKEIDSLRFTNEVERRGLTDVVFYGGKKYGEEKDMEFANTDIFVFPTFYDNECFPLVLLEAMQQGAAAITTDVGGIPDIVEDEKTGLIYTPQDATSLAMKIKELFDSPQKVTELGRNGQKVFEDRYTLDIWEKNMTKILNDLLSYSCL